MGTKQWEDVLERAFFSRSAIKFCVSVLFLLSGGIMVDFDQVRKARGGNREAGRCYGFSWRCYCSPLNGLGASRVPRKPPGYTPSLVGGKRKT